MINKSKPNLTMSKVNSALLDQQLKAEAPVAEAGISVSEISRYSACFVSYSTVTSGLFGFRRLNSSIVAAQGYLLSVKVAVQNNHLLK